MEQMFHLFVPLGEMVALGRAGSRGDQRKSPNVDPVEILQPGTAPVESSEVDDAEPDPVDLSVGHRAALVGAAVLPRSLGLGHLHGDLGQVLHVEDQTKDG